MSDSLAISVRNLGMISLAKYCPRCLYYLLRMRFRAPFNDFGAGIFRHMQTIQEAVIGYHLDQEGCLPKEFSPFRDCASRIEYPKTWRKFRYTHKKGIVLYGEPDEIFQLKDGTLCVIDHKTARFKGNDDSFHGQYQAQVVGYANIAEVGLNLGTVTKGGLIYWEIQTEAVASAPEDYCANGHVSVPMVPKPLEIEIDYSILDPLIDEAKKVWKASAAPDGNDGCKNCEKLNLLFAIERDSEAQDSLTFARYWHLQDAREAFVRRALKRRYLKNICVPDDSELSDNAFFADLPAGNWECPATMEE